GRQYRATGPKATAWPVQARRRRGAEASRCASRGVPTAAKAGRIVVVVARVSGGAVVAAFAVLEGVHEEAADEGALGIGDPLVEIADQVVDGKLVGAAKTSAGGLHGARELVQAWVVQERWLPHGRAGRAGLRRGLEEADDGMRFEQREAIVAHVRAPLVAVGIPG